MHAARRLATVAALAVVALTGCANEPEPRFAEPTDSAEPTPTGEVDTETLRDAERESVQRFVDAVSSGLATGDSSELRSITSPSCQNCQTLATNIEKAFADGRRVEGAGWTISTAEYAGRLRGFAEWKVVVAASEERAFDEQGRLVNVVDATDLNIGLLVDPRSEPPVANFSFEQ